MSLFAEKPEIEPRTADMRAQSLFDLPNRAAISRSKIA